MRRRASRRLGPRQHPGDVPAGELLLANSRAHTSPSKRRIEVVRTTVELNGKMTYGTPKTHQRRSVPLPRALVYELARHIAGNGPDDLVFTTTHEAS